MHGAVTRVQMAVVSAGALPGCRAARVFVQFADAAAAAAAVRPAWQCSTARRAAPCARSRGVARQAAALDGRFFAGRHVRCAAYPDARFAAGDWEA